MLKKGSYGNDHTKILKVYTIITRESDLINIINKIKIEQAQDRKIINIKSKLVEEDMTLVKYYKIYDDLIFIKNNRNLDIWKLLISDTLIKEIIVDYHERCRHMGYTKVALGISHTRPYVVTAIKGPNTYELSNKLSEKKKGLYNYREIKI